MQSRNSLAGTVRSRDCPSARPSSYGVVSSWNLGIWRPHCQSTPRGSAPPRVRGVRLRPAKPRLGRWHTTRQRRQEDRCPAWELAEVPVRHIPYVRNRFGAAVSTGSTSLGAGDPRPVRTNDLAGEHSGQCRIGTDVNYYRKLFMPSDPRQRWMGGRSIFKTSSAQRVPLGHFRAAFPGEVRDNPTL